MKRTQEEIREKGFSIVDKRFMDKGGGYLDFSKIKIDSKNVSDPILDLQSSIQNRNSYDKTTILRAIGNQNQKDLRKISNFYFQSSGIYSRLCKYIAYLYKYDWYLVPYINENKDKKQEKKDKKQENKILKSFSEILMFYENSQIAKTCGDIALSIVKNGCYYGYLTDNKRGIFIQELPIDYCRSRFSKDNFPIVEFNMKFFDDNFKDAAYRANIISSFPKEFAKGYVLYKKGKLKPDFQGDSNGWYLLDPNRGVKFNNGGSDIPMLVNAVPSIIDLNEAQGLDKKRMMQKLMKLVIQKIPTDKRGDLLFDVTEAADIHNNAVLMLKNAIGTDVLTTFTDVTVANLADSKNTTATDDLDKVERSLYNEFGVSRNLFNAESNLALEKSILDDEASIRNIPKQFEAFYNRILDNFNKNPKKYYFKFRMLETTIYNYKDISKIYKEQSQLGYSKILTQIALGHTQGEILSMIYFEDKILHLSDLMIPPRMSSTMGNKNQNDSSKVQKEQGQNIEDKQVGRPEKEDDKKSDKTIANKESM